MYNRGVDQLLASLPQIEGIDGDAVKRLLTSAWVDALEVRDQDSPSPDGAETPLRRLATALELHAVLPNQIELEMLRACAFVAAEALSVAAEVQPMTDALAQPWLFGDTARYERIETGLLYLIAGYDANAALCARALRDNEVTTEPTGAAAAEDWTLRAVLALLSGARADDSAEPELADNTTVSVAARHEVLLRIGRAVRRHLRWLRMDEPENTSLADLTAVAADLSAGLDGEPAAVAHPDLYHLVLLLTAACGETTRRALRDVPPPPADDTGVFSTYQRSRAVERPLLWPAAQQYANSALPGPDSHAVVAVPTGAGKSAVAELAIAQALTDGWVLYLAPTNALVGQIRRQLQQAFQPLPDVAVDQFFGGSEYTVLSEEGIDEIQDSHILVMTPEKCSLALRVNPDAFQRLALCVVDEAHGIGETGTRAAVLELVIAEVLHRAPAVKALLMSALIANPQDLASWLENVTGFAAHAVVTPWRPTRTLRALAGFDRDNLQTSGDAAERELDELPPRRKNVAFSSKIGLLTGLQGAWSSSQTEDYKYVVTNVRGALKATRRLGRVVLNSDGYLNPAVGNLVQALGDNGHRVMAFLPRSRHDSFTVARDMTGFGAIDLGQEVAAYLDLANAELGVASAVRGLLGKGIAVHTSAMLREEQRASEAAFEQGQVRAIFATGTLAQGLNLPATAVVIGGTQIGYDPSSTRREDAARSRAQLLNAIGRAGRAQIATRSVAIVVPNNAQIISAERVVSDTVTAAEFLREEDASTEVASQLSALIEATVRDDVELGAMTAAEEAAFAFLSFEGGEDTSEVIAKSGSTD
jgi:DEAD/DEAH box helicase/Helicase conserved C-terminal domain